MKKFQLSVPKPCHENWEAMTPEARGRFCAACQKTVIDFSTMSDSQIAAFFKKPVDSVCGHFSQSQLNRVIEVPKKRLPWVRYFFTIALPAFLFSLKAGAQGEVKLRGRIALKVQPDKKDTCTKPAEKQQLSDRVQGRVVNENGDPLQNATVTVEGTNVATSTNQDGSFELSYPSIESQLLIISYVGYESKKIAAKDSNLKPILMVGALSGEIVVVGRIKPKKVKTIPLVETKKSDTSYSSFAVYPNPVISNTMIKIEPKKLESGSYSLQIINSSGNLVQTGEIAFDKKARTLDYTIMALPAGPYFLQLTNQKSKKSYTEILVVQ
jgi:hypothetical protein